MNFNQFFVYPIKEFPFVLLALMIAFTFHEYAHAVVADKFGDPTPRLAGRVTLNPRVHLDILGTLLIFIAGFGWAKPVMVNRSYFKKPRLMGILVSIAGPLSNLLIGFLGIVIVYILVKFHMLTGLSQGSIDAIVVFLKLLIHLNLLLFVFNLIPLPPLDGYRILQDVLPHDLRMKAAKYEQWAVYIFLLMVFIPPLSAVTIGPILQLTNVLQNSFYQLLLTLFGPAA